MKNRIDMKGKKVNREEMRLYFKKTGLSYSLITKEDIMDLATILSNELENYLSYGGEHAKK